ncbi:MAG: hypothetical protein A2Z97_04985 [Bdellovibrionales bacterium GWB1_52_6]|nr:MAG: hypothetical protein A2Z97_04985 [Bdellovibrionales bacterium GWB1_52_6]OFZ06374.1 MAG: hypothetical protein A2X97_02835 [Bdellovibrionales bacterium GWA1_52_35]HCM40128.1 hypothetical protein [Bdellovibrionales bacterium]
MIAISALGSLAAWAQDDMGSRTEAKVPGGLKEEKLAVRPQAGVLVFKDAQREDTSRFAAGLTLDWNIASTVMPESMSNWYIGPSTGIIYSHLGNSDANFFGTDSEVSQGNEGANFFYVPANVKIGYNFTDNFRLAAHGGANITYRSQPNSIVIGTDQTSKTTAFPNVGADMEWGLGGVALGLRPDVTLGTEEAIYTGSLTLAIPLA